MKKIAKSKNFNSIWLKMEHLFLLGARDDWVCPKNIIRTSNTSIIAHFMTFVILIYKINLICRNYSLWTCHS